MTISRKPSRALKTLKPISSLSLASDFSISVQLYCTDCITGRILWRELGQGWAEPRRATAPPPLPSSVAQLGNGNAVGSMSLTRPPTPLAPITPTTTPPLSSSAGGPQFPATIPSRRRSRRAGSCVTFRLVHKPFWGPILFLFEGFYAAFEGFYAAFVCRVYAGFGVRFGYC